MTAKPAVVVTGTSTGIGRATVRLLASRGFMVFAAARSADAISDLRTDDGDIHPVLLDVTDAASIRHAESAVEQQLQGRVLRAIVNNAGVTHPCPLETIDLDDLRSVLEVNLCGVLRVTQAFLPLLETPGGRVINIGSGEGFIVLPINGAYAISKHGLEALSRGLRLELRASGRFASVVVPGLVATAIQERALVQYEQILSTPANDRYRSQVLGRRRITQRGLRGSSPDRSAAAIQRAITARKPRHHYYAGQAARIPVQLSRLPTRLGDLLLRQAVR
jgi:NAD(P)-dependent dehydrogenase (short-subunit alcohol dehydrogenase family)